MQSIAPYLSQTHDVKHGGGEGGVCGDVDNGSAPLTDLQQWRDSRQSTITVLCVILALSITVLLKYWLPLLSLIWPLLEISLESWRMHVHSTVFHWFEWKVIQDAAMDFGYGLSILKKTRRLKVKVLP